jgi:voltage-gated potassium channel
MRRALLHLFSRRAFRKLIVFLLFTSLSLAILVVPLEHGHPKARILNLEDALWWTISTITTVGYGDMVPVTTQGRMIGALLQLIGVMLFGTMIGSIAYQLNRRHDAHQVNKIHDQLADNAKQLATLQKKIDFLILQTSDKRSKSK